ncbi:cytoplasmic polyadenylated homeobox-like protein 2 [Peromyscus californicus insignis]|uniref:cytoplasmic polyadenylated homeobox-like protein 2 n=1 Tax=Peromyscus californicus insignis TaxID=564181 RepID=UPI0022A7EA5C|nr:cytoplasmic polyadenylated homeobox-like protein 2 [Peromyscus californicus insignis]
MRFCFHLSGSPGTEDNGSKARAEHGRRRLKPRHKFTEVQLKILRKLFENSNYPDFETKNKLAQCFRCQVYVIENWFQNKRSRLLPKLKGKNFAAKRTHKSQDCMLTGHQDTQAQAVHSTTEQVSSVQLAPWSLAACSVETQEASGSRDSAIQSIGMRSSGAACHQGAGGSGFPLSFTPTNFAPPSLRGQYPMGDWPKTWRSQCSTSSVFGCVPSVQGQWWMDSNYALLFPEQQQNNWGDQPGLLQSGDLKHQDPFDPSNGDAAGSQMQPAPLQEAVRAPMPFWLDGQQGAANSCVYCPAGDGSHQNRPVGSPRLPWDQQEFKEQHWVGLRWSSGILQPSVKPLTHNEDPGFPRVDEFLNKHHITTPGVRDLAQW